MGQAKRRKEAGTYPQRTGDKTKRTDPPTRRGWKMRKAEGERPNGERVELAVANDKRRTVYIRTDAGLRRATSKPVPKRDRMRARRHARNAGGS